MTAPAATPQPPLEIHGVPRPVKRFSKRALMVLLGTGSAIVLGSLVFALQGPKESPASASRELYNTGHNPPAEREGRMRLPEKDAPEVDPMREQMAALEAELHAREAALSDAARGSGVFFQVGSGAGTKIAGGGGTNPSAASIGWRHRSHPTS